MGNRKENAILIFMGLIMIVLFIISMLNPQPADAASIAAQKPTQNVSIY